MEAFDAPALDAPTILPDAFVAVQSVVRFRAASAAYATDADDDPAHTVYYPRLLGDIEVGTTTHDALGIGGRVGLTISDFDLWDADQQLQHIIADGSADGRTALVRVVPVTDPRASNFGTALGSAQVAFAGIVRGVEHTAAQYARVSLTDLAERLATPLQATKYLGTGGVEGPASLAGRPVPVCIGTVYNISPVYLGNVDLGGGDGSLPTYQINYRAISAIDAVRIRGVAQSLVGSAPGVGEYTAHLSSGLLQLGSTPDGPVTVDADGDLGDGFTATISAVVERLITTLGPQFTAAELQAESFDFAETDLPGDIGYFQGAEETTGLDAVDRILSSCGASLCGGRGGTVRLFDPLAAAAAQWNLPAAYILDIEPIPLPAALRPLPYSVAVDWAPNWTPITDIAGSVSDDDRAKLIATASGPARASSNDVNFRVLQQRELRLPGLYATSAAALARAERWRDFLAASPRAFRIATDRYLGSIECGDVGRFDYPAFGLGSGVSAVVVGWREQLSARRLILDVVTVPWVAGAEDETGNYDIDMIIGVKKWA